MIDGSEWLGRARLAVFALLVLSAGVGSCRVVQDLVSAPSPTPGSAATPAPPSATPTPSRDAGGVRATPSPVATAAEDRISQAEAQQLVRAWFEALASEDYQRAAELTSGDATRQTRDLADAIQMEASQQGVQVDIVVRGLDLTPGARPQRGEAVDAGFDVAVNAAVGPFSVQARQAQGSTTFVVERVEGRPRITDIQNATGLPLQ